MKHLALAFVMLAASTFARAADITGKKITTINISGGTGNFLPLTGGTLSGPLTALGGVIFADGTTITSTTPFSGNGMFLPLSGGTMSGAVFVTSITSVAQPLFAVTGASATAAGVGTGLALTATDGSGAAGAGGPYKGGSVTILGGNGGASTPDVSNVPSGGGVNIVPGRNGPGGRFVGSACNYLGCLPTTNLGGPVVISSPTDAGANGTYPTYALSIVGQHLTVDSVGNLVSQSSASFQSISVGPTGIAWADGTLSTSANSSSGFHGVFFATVTTGGTVNFALCASSFTPHLPSGPTIIPAVEVYAAAYGYSAASGSPQRFSWNSDVGTPFGGTSLAPGVFLNAAYCDQISLVVTGTNGPSATFVIKATFP